MVVLITSLTSETRVSLDAERVRATAARCGKPMTVWTYTLPSEFGRSSAAGCGLFMHSDLRNVGVAMSRLAGLRGGAGAAPARLARRRRRARRCPRICRTC